MKHLIIDESGQGLTEYILIVLLVALAAFAIMALFGDTISKAFGDAKEALNQARTAATH